MGHKVYISFKFEDRGYKDSIQQIPGLDFIDKSLNSPINSDNIDYILQTIRNDYLSDSTVTIHLIGAYGAESRGSFEQRFIKRELQASLYHGADNTKSGILGVVLPSMQDTVYRGSSSCLNCGKSHNVVSINDNTTIKEFSYNYYVPHGGCAWSEDERYCVLVPWDSFVSSPDSYIDDAFDKRSSPIASKTKVRP